MRRSIAPCRSSTTRSSSSRARCAARSRTGPSSTRPTSRETRKGKAMTVASLAPAHLDTDRFGNPRDPTVGYARGAIIVDEVSESLRQQRAYGIIRDRYARLGDAGVFNLTGLIRAFPFAPGDEDSMRSYVHFVARWQGELEEVALQRLGGKPGAHLGFLANRVSAAMLAIMLAILEEGSR